ncbi:MAG: bile acid:sodium symporter family protein, partial [Pseudonocardiaceae bacterium]
GDTLGLQFSKVLQVIAIVLVPVGIGMLVRRRSETFAARADRPVRVFSILVLVMVSVGAILGERENIADYLQEIGVVVTLFCCASLTLGYLGARVFRLGQAQAVATSMEVGIHNTTVALTIALSVLDSTAVAIPAAVYSLVMYVLATAFGLLITRSRLVRPAAPHDVVT